MDLDKLTSAIRDDLSSRVLWDTRQAMFYEMRYHGLRRRSKPWPGASDVHFPLADSVIERLKPFYFQQLFGTDTLASFVARRPGVNGTLANAAAQWFDFQLKQRSNLESEVLIAIDKLLLSGRPAIKVIWDAAKKRLVFTTVPSQQIIVPAATRSLEDADRICHVQTYSVEAYKRETNFIQDPGLIARITGEGQLDDQSSTELNAAKYRREGLTHGPAGMIVLWEIWTRNAAGSWEFTTVSPLAPTQPVRATIGCPYKHGLPPFVDFPYEITDAGWYSPRGVVEIVAVFEAELNKLLNEKNDAMTLYNRPLFTSSTPTTNAGNLRWVPGQILPGDVKAVEMKQPPISFDVQINLMREIAERLVAVPDYGLTQNGSGKDPRTATEINAIGTMTQQSGDMRMRIFRGSLGKLYRLSWALLLQYATDELTIYANDTVTEIPKDALHDVYAVAPSGSSDGINRAMAMQKAMARFQLFKGDPYIAQDELRKSLLEADDAGLVKRLYSDPGLEAATQAEQQAQEITVLRLGFPAVVTAADDDAVHIQTLIAYVMHQSESGQLPKQTEAQFLSQHFQQHLQQLHAKDPQQAKQAAEAWQTVGAALSQQAQAGQAGGQSPTQPNPNAQTAPQDTAAPQAPVA